MDVARKETEAKSSGRCYCTQTHWGWNSSKAVRLGRPLRSRSTVGSVVECMWVDTPDNALCLTVGTPKLDHSKCPVGSGSLQLHQLEGVLNRAEFDNEISVSSCTDMHPCLFPHIFFLAHRTINTIILTQPINQQLTRRIITLLFLLSYHSTIHAPSVLLTCDHASAISVSQHHSRLTSPPKTHTTTSCMHHPPSPTNRTITHAPVVSL